MRLFKPHTLSRRLSSPHILSVTNVPNKCYNETNGSVTVTFDRPLKPNELLSVSLNDINKGYFRSNDNLTILGAGNTVTFNNMAPGNYNVSLIGKYPNTDVITYSTGTYHTGTTAFTGPEAVDFNISGRNVYCKTEKDGVIYRKCKRWRRQLSGRL